MDHTIYRMKLCQFKQTTLWGEWNLISQFPLAFILLAQFPLPFILLFPLLLYCWLCFHLPLYYCFHLPLCYWLIHAYIILPTGLGESCWIVVKCMKKKNKHQKSMIIFYVLAGPCKKGQELKNERRAPVQPKRTIKYFEWIRMEQVFYQNFVRLWSKI